MDIVIIPAYEPDESLIQVVNKVRALSIGAHHRCQRWQFGSLPSPF